MPDLSSVLERADRAVSRLPLPTDGLERLRRRRDRKRRNQRIAAGVVGIAVFVAAVWIASTGGPFRSTHTPANGSTGPTDASHPVGVGLIGFPAEGAQPSAPEHGELVLTFIYGHTLADAGRFSLRVYADGRLIWDRLGNNIGGANIPSTGLIEQRLTPEGVELVRAEVLSTGLFERDVVLADTIALPYGGIEVLDGNRLVHVTWGDGIFGYHADSVQTMTPDLARTLEQLDARLEDPASWLPASAWEDQTLRPYVPTTYQVCYTGRSEPIDRSLMLALLPQPAEDLLRPLSTTRGDWNGPAGTKVPSWCSVVTTEHARDLASALEDAGASKVEPELLEYTYSPESFSDISISIWPVLPHE